MILGFCCFKQKTAYEMRISDWSSDVCSSDLNPAFYAVTSGVVLYNALTHDGARPLDGAMPARQKSALVDAIKSVIKHGKIYISTNPTDRQLALGVQQKVEEMERMGPIIAQMS